MDKKLKDVFTKYVEYKFNVDLDTVTEEEFEKYEKVLRKQYDKSTDDEIILYLNNEISTDKRLKEQYYYRLYAWCALNGYIFWDIGFDLTLSYSGLFWLIGGTIFILTIWGVIMAFMERIWLMNGWNLYIWRTIEYVSMYLISKNIVQAIV